MKHRPRKPKRRTTKPFTIGWAAFAKISAIEGISMPESMEKDFQEFDRWGLSAEERRRLISKKYGNGR